MIDILYFVCKCAHYLLKLISFQFSVVVGGLDGTFNGKKYFSCPKGRGIFIQAQDIVNIITKKVCYAILSVRIKNYEM